MEYKYTINDIASKTKVSIQSLYALIKKNKEFINNHSRRKQRKVFYDQEAFNFFMEYYGQGLQDELSSESLETASEAKIDEKKESESQEQISALKAEIEALKAKLEDTEKERKELLQQNGALILTIQQQQQEKMLLLPAPKKSLWDRVFSKRSGKEAGK